MQISKRDDSDYSSSKTQEPNLKPGPAVIEYFRERLKDKRPKYVLKPFWIYHFNYNIFWINYIVKVREHSNSEFFPLLISIMIS